MEATPSPVGVAAASPTPPQWPVESRWIEPPNPISVRLSSELVPAWSRPAQGAAGLLLLLALSLLGWHAWSAQRGSCRPATIEADAFHSLSLDLNQADHVQLLQLPGIGSEQARRIEAYRAEHHGFRDVDELRRVKGIGPKTLEKLRTHVYVEVPARDEGDEPAVATPPIKTSKVEKETKPAAVRKKESLTERIDVNHATAEELRRLPGIGPTLSQRIIETRTKQPFQSVEDLRRVRGIGAKTLERLRPHVLIVER
jgi:competence protein ComEA